MLTQLGPKAAGITWGQGRKNPFVAMRGDKCKWQASMCYMWSR